MRGYQIGINSGFMSPNDVRALEDQTSIPPPGGDVYRMNSAMKDINELTEGSE
jgi:hypothetical protein